MDEEDEFVEVSCDIIRQTQPDNRYGGALLIDAHDGQGEQWIPKSQIKEIRRYDPKVRSASVLMKEWIAKEKGLI